MTDLDAFGHILPSRLGTTARLQGDRFLLDLAPTPAICRHGVVRASVVSYLADAITGILVDGDPDSWTLTTDLTVRMLAVPAPGRMTASVDFLRESKRSITCRVDVHDEFGRLLSVCAAGFTKLPRRDGDPPKPQVSVEMAVERFGRSGVITSPLREEAGIRTIDAAAGIVEVAVTPPLRNPNGTLQGAMVALVAECAAEDLIEARCGVPAVVADLDIRYLNRATDGPVRSECTVLGDGPDAAVEVRLYDTSADRITTLVHARAQKIDG